MPEMIPKDLLVSAIVTVTVVVQLVSVISCCKL